MTDDATGGLARSHDEIQAARLLGGAGHCAAAVSRAYYAAFYAAEAALLTLGETRSRHSGVTSALAQIAVKRHALEEEAARLLRSLFDRRSEADYGMSVVAREDAEAAARMPNGLSS